MAVEPLKAFADFAADQLGEGIRRGGYTFYLCPSHDDHDPSFTVKNGATRGRCFACGFQADAVALVQCLNPGMPFREVKAIVTGEQEAPKVERQSPAPVRKEADTRPPGWAAFALGLVEESEVTLWSDAGAEARAYLLGRGLKVETIRAARLGLFPADRWFEGIFANGKVWAPEGIAIPWFEAGSVAMINIRRPDEVLARDPKEPKYRTVRGSRRGRPHPSRDPIVAGKPIVIVEGEFEALLLNQELDALVGAVTFGGASDRPEGLGLDVLAPGSPWYIAVDIDRAGIISAGEWLASSDRCRRVLPPVGKDWTESHQKGVGLRRWWSDRLAGVESPALYSWAELSALRWGAAVGDSTAGIRVPRGWRARVAELPHDRWVAWRGRSGESQEALGHQPTANEIHQCDRQAAAEIGIVTASTLTSE